MKYFLGKILIATTLLSLTSCDQVKTGFAQLGGGEPGPEALPETESLAGEEGLPVVTSFQKVTSSSLTAFTGAGDRISVLEFYSDT